MSDPMVTVVVTCRERFSIGTEPLAQMLADASCPFELVFVAGGAPRTYRRDLEHRLEGSRHELVVEPEFQYQNRARNLGLKRARGKYVAFVDNDLLVRPGWLTALVDAAESTGAAIATPLQLEGPLEAEVIHCFGGTLEVTESALGRAYSSRRHLQGLRVEDARAELVRRETAFSELHCVLVRRNLFERIGPLDERLFTVSEYDDLCWLAREAGETLVAEPTSVVSYLFPERLAWSDRRYFSFRWSLEQTRASLDHFGRKWNVGARSGSLESTLGFVRYHRRLLRPGPVVALSRFRGRVQDRLAARAARGA